MARYKIILKSQSGLTLVELLVSLGVLGIVLLISSSQLALFSNLMHNAERKQEASGLAHQIETLVSSSHNCTISLENKTVNPTGEVAVDDLFYAVEDPAALGTYIKAANPAFQRGATVGSTIISDLRVKVVEKLSGLPRRYLSEVVFTLTDKVDEEQYSFAGIPVLLTTDASDVVQYCTTIDGGGDALKEKLCEITGSGMQIYDPATGECKPRITGTWYTGTEAGASCPDGHKLVNPSDPWNTCDADPPAGWTDSFDTKRNFKDGTTVGAPTWLKPISQGANACRCVYAQDIADTSSFVCKALCYDPADPGIIF